MDTPASSFIARRGGGRMAASGRARKGGATTHGSTPFPMPLIPPKTAYPTALCPYPRGIYTHRVTCAAACRKGMQLDATPRLRHVSVKGGDAKKTPRAPRCHRPCAPARTTHKLLPFQGASYLRPSIPCVPYASLVLPRALPLPSSVRLGQTYGLPLC